MMAKGIELGLHSLLTGLAGLTNISGQARVTNKAVEDNRIELGHFVRAPANLVRLLIRTCTISSLALVEVSSVRRWPVRRLSGVVEDWSLLETLLSLGLLACLLLTADSLKCGR